MDYLTIEEIKEANADKGGYWFSEGALAFFDSIIYPTVYGGQWFISSECPPMGTRAYSIRVAMRNGDIGTVGDFMGYDTLEDAEEGARALERGEVPTSSHWPRWEHTYLDEDEVTHTEDLGTGDMVLDTEDAVTPIKWAEGE